MTTNAEGLRREITVRSTKALIMQVMIIMIIITVNKEKKSVQNDVSYKRNYG